MNRRVSHVRTFVAAAIFGSSVVAIGCGAATTTEAGLGWLQTIGKPAAA